MLDEIGGEKNPTRNLRALLITESLPHRPLQLTGFHWGLVQETGMAKSLNLLSLNYLCVDLDMFFDHHVLLEDPTMNKL